jgi:hypothetical protein
MAARKKAVSKKARGSSQKKASSKAAGKKPSSSRQEGTGENVRKKIRGAIKKTGSGAKG